MLLTRKKLMVLAGILGLLAVSACTREITTIVQQEPEPSSCFECHSDQNTFMVAAEVQWSHSVHASGMNTSRSSSATCSGCHSSEGFLDRAAGNQPGVYSNPTIIHCFTCHQPHTNGNFDLRLTAAQTVLTGASYDIGAGNLCVACHQARRDVAVYVTASNNLSTYWGPHYSPQADILFATNGYRYAGYTYEETPYHRTLTQDGCLDCHMRTVGQNYVLGGHSFNMTATLPDEEGGGTVRNTGACKACHTDIGSDFNYRGVQAAVDAKSAELAALLIAAGFLDAEGHGRAVTGVSRDDAGAVWNYLLVHSSDRSRGVHNPEYAMGLLQSSIDYMNARPSK